MAKDADDVRRELGTDGLRTLCDSLPDLDFKEPAPRRQTQPLADEDYPPGLWSWPKSDCDAWLDAFNARSNGLAGADDQFVDGLDKPAGEDLADESFNAEAITVALTEAGEKAAERLCELLADIPPKNRDPIAMARLIKLAGRLSKVGVTAIKLQIKTRDSQLRIVRAGPGRLHGGEKPVIRIVAGEVSRIIDQIETAMLAANPGLYQRNGSIVRIETAVIAMPDAPKRPTLVIRTQEADDLREALCKAAKFQKYDRRIDKWITCDPPVQRARDWIARRERMRLPPLTGVMLSPLILPVERRIISRPGYDVGTGLFFEPLGASFPPVPEHPTRDDARAALKLLRTLLMEFPFAGGEHGPDESVMLSAFISAVMRPAIGNTPLHAFNAPAARTGKSLAATLVSVISHGRAPPLCTAGRSEEKLEKRIDALLLESPPFFLIDNIDHPLESAALCVLLTQEEKSVRPLGTSTIREVTIRPFVECTGNNLVLVGDLAGRAIRCTLNAKCEAPEFREIKRPALLRDVKKDRGPYAVAALTIVQAFICAGAKSQSLPLGSFEKWSLYVRDALIWLGCADPCDTMEAIRKENPRRNDLSMVMCAWGELFGGEYRTAREAIADAAAEYKGALVHQNLHDALMHVAGDRGTINSRRLGNWLTRNKEVVADGRYFADAGADRKGMMLWTLRENRPAEKKTK